MELPLAGGCVSFHSISSGVVFVSSGAGMDAKEASRKLPSLWICTAVIPIIAQPMQKVVHRMTAQNIRQNGIQ